MPLSRVSLSGYRASMWSPMRSALVLRHSSIRKFDFGFSVALETSVTESLSSTFQSGGVGDLDSNNSNALNLDHVIRKKEPRHLDRRTGRQTRAEVAMTNVYMLEKFFDISHVGRSFYEIRKRRTCGFQAHF